jgi:hypothetical protein
MSNGWDELLKVAWLPVLVLVVGCWLLMSANGKARKKLRGRGVARNVSGCGGAFVVNGILLGGLLIAVLYALVISGWTVRP